MTEEEKQQDWERCFTWISKVAFETTAYVDELCNYLNLVRCKGARAPSCEFNPENKAFVAVWSYVDIPDVYFDVAWFPNHKCGWYYRNGDKVIGKFEPEDYTTPADVPLSFPETFQ